MSQIIQIQSDQTRALFQKLYLNKELSDIDLVLDSKKISAHRLVLALNSDFFKVLCYGDFKEASTREVHINDAPVEAFTKILKYLYFGEMNLEPESLENILVLLELCHRFGIKDLENEIIANILKYRLNFETAAILFCVGKHLEAANLSDNCLQLIEPNIVSQSTFLYLSESGLCDILKACNWKEVDKCFVVGEWLKFQNKEKNAKKISKLIDLSKCTQEEILHAAVPTNIFNSSDLIDALVCKGIKHTDVTTGPSNESGFRYRSFKVSNGPDPKYQIVLALESTFTFNHIEFSIDEYGASYYIEVCEERIGNSWIKIIDYGKFICFRYQDLYFKPVNAKFIRIVSTSQIHSNHIRIYNAAQVPKTLLFPDSLSIVCLDKSVPFTNHLSANPSIAVRVEKIASSALRGDGMITMHQPFWMDSFRLRVRDLSGGTKYRFYVQVFDHESKQTVYVTKKRVEGWHDIKFEPRIVKTIHVFVEKIYSFFVDFEHIT